MMIFQLAVEFEYDGDLFFYLEVENEAAAYAASAKFFEGDGTVNHVDAVEVPSIPKGALIIAA